MSDASRKPSDVFGRILLALFDNRTIDDQRKIEQAAREFPRQVTHMHERQIRGYMELHKMLREHGPKHVENELERRVLAAQRGLSKVREGLGILYDMVGLSARERQRLDDDLERLSRDIGEYLDSY